MKKILFTILISIFGVMSSKAQEIDSLQLKSDSITVESLAARLDKLQHDYDYLYCENKFNCIQYEIKIFANNVSIESNSIRTFYFNNQFSVALYNSYNRGYEAKMKLYDTFKNSLAYTKSIVNLKIASSNFSDKEITYFNDYAVYLDSCLSSAEEALVHYKAGLDAYRSM